ncbi:MAG: hypothetical protein R3C28_33640 [Pirellulaceae bacterium]
MNGVEQNPYAASRVVATDTRRLSGVARRVSFRTLQSLFLAVLFCLSFLFLGCSAKSGITSGWDYTIFFVTEYPFLTAAIVLWNALLRGILLPRLQLTTVWLPLVAGVASFLSFNPVHFRVDSISQMIIRQGWDSGTVEFVSMGIVPSFVGIIVEGVGHGMHLLVKRNTKKSVA